MISAIENYKILVLGAVIQKIIHILEWCIDGLIQNSIFKVVTFKDEYK